LIENNVFISNSYSAGIITAQSGATQVGGFLGLLDEGSSYPGSSITNSFWDSSLNPGLSSQSVGYSQIAGSTSTVVSITPSSTASMTGSSSVYTTAGWNFSTIWISPNSSVNSGYPTLF
jgi:hypothetical protein